VELVQRWWNGRFGRLARRDVWLERDTTWRVRARDGDGDSPTKTWTFNNRAEADALVHRLITAEPADGWKDITDISSQSPKRDQVAGRASSVPSGQADTVKNGLR
jgi:hypothetical protein